MNSGIADITPLTLLDFPNKVACIFWMNGCNLACQYCYNVSLVKKSHSHSQNYLQFLKERAGFLDGVVMSGGECTLNPHLINICQNALDLGYAIKIDTNGTNPQVIRALVETNLCHYIALDYKAPRDKYKHITGNNKLFANFEETLNYLISVRFPFEVRTTVHTQLLQENDINDIITDLEHRAYSGTYYLQNFFPVECTLGMLPPQSRTLEKSLIHTKIPVEYRNFT